MENVIKADCMLDNGTDYERVLVSTSAELVEYLKRDGQKGNLQEALGGYSLRVVDARPATQEEGIIYLVRKAGS